jgi:hypothetical protein
MFACLQTACNTLVLTLYCIVEEIRFERLEFFTEIFLHLTKLLLKRKTLFCYSRRKHFSEAETKTNYCGRGQQGPQHAGRACKTDPCLI